MKAGVEIEFQRGCTRQCALAAGVEFIDENGGPVSDFGTPQKRNPGNSPQLSATTAAVALCG
jgi:hypothetical protein